ncbi:MAG: molecular chaperone TorD family protein [Acidimicrobiia bacterium]|nr:molecular chaperone TorD family protein [Acidimicrobiia bacterium]
MTPTAAGAADHQAAAVARSELWASLADWLTFPTDDFVSDFAAGRIASEARRLVDALAYPFPYPLPLDSDGLASGDPEEVEVEFIRLFDVPSGGAPVPLYGGVHGGDRRQVMEELLRFYRHFGLSVANAPERDLPDAIPTVLEFLAFLCAGEAEAVDAEAVQTFRSVQRDILERHVTKWMPPIAGRLAKKDPMSLYRALIDLLGHFAAAEHAALSAA